MGARHGMLTFTLVLSIMTAPVSNPSSVLPDASVTADPRTVQPEQPVVAPSATNPPTTNEAIPPVGTTVGGVGQPVSAQPQAPTGGVPSATGNNGIDEIPDSGSLDLPTDLVASTTPQSSLNTPVAQGPVPSTTPQASLNASPADNTASTGMSQAVPPPPHHQF